MSENQPLTFYNCQAPQLDRCRVCGGEAEGVYCPALPGFRGGPWVYVRCQQCGFEVNNDAFLTIQESGSRGVKRMAELVISEWNQREFRYTPC